MKYSHRNGETTPPEIVGHFWFRGIVRGESVAEKVTVMKYALSNLLAVIGVEAGSRLEDYHGEWWGPEEDIPPWEKRKK